MNRGKLAVLLMFALAFAAAIFAWMYQRHRTRHALKFWGPQAALLVRQAPQVELLRLEPVQGDGLEEPSEPLAFDGQQWRIVERIDISRAAGLINARAALMQDAALSFAPPPGDCQPKWPYALQFSDERRSQIAALDFTCRRICRLGPPEREAGMSEKLGSGLKRFLEEQAMPAR